jgi:hypothetical protein
MDLTQLAAFTACMAGSDAEKLSAVNMSSRPAALPSIKLSACCYLLKLPTS